MWCEPTKVASAWASASLPHAASSGRPRIEYSSSEPCALTRNGTPVAAPTGPPISTWFVNTTSAGSSSRSAAAFASTYARFSPSVKSCRNFGSRPAYRSMTKTGSSRPGRSTAIVCAEPRSYCSGSRSCETTTTSCPALLHSRASARL